MKDWSLSGDPQGHRNLWRGNPPHSVAVMPDGSTVYVANFLSNNVAVIDTASNRVTTTIPVGADVFTRMLAVAGEACRMCSVRAGLSPPKH
jgi:YVTN family beta-propeller protein